MLPIHMGSRYSSRAAGLHPLAPQLPRSSGLLFVVGGWECVWEVRVWVWECVWECGSVCVCGRVGVGVGGGGVGVGVWVCGCGFGRVGGWVGVNKNKGNNSAIHARAVTLKYPRQ